MIGFCIRKLIDLFKLTGNNKKMIFYIFFKEKYFLDRSSSVNDKLGI